MIEDDFNNDVKRGSLKGLKTSKIDEASRQLLYKVIRILCIVAIAASCCMIALIPLSKALGITFISVHGSSMEPTFKNGQSLPLAPADKIKAGNIVVTSPPEEWIDQKLIEDDTFLIKRIIALPGDEIEINGRALSVNGEIVTEVNSDAVGCNFTKNTTTVPDGKFFAMGDNRLASFDSYAAWCLDEPSIPYFFDLDDLEIQGNKWELWIF